MPFLVTTRVVFPVLTRELRTFYARFEAEKVEVYLIEGVMWYQEILTRRPSTGMLASGSLHELDTIRLEVNLANLAERKRDRGRLRPYPNPNFSSPRERSMLRRPF